MDEVIFEEFKGTSNSEIILDCKLAHILADPLFGPHIDRPRIFALGFSLGGATALNLVGAKTDRALYKDYCARLSKEAVDCVFFAKGGVDFNSLPEGFEAEMRDPRITSAIAIDPGMTYAMTEQSIAAMTMPVLLINLGGDERLRASDVGRRGSNLARRLPHAEYAATFASANHFTFLALCKPEGSRLLLEERDDPVCDDPEGSDRKKIHDAIADRIAMVLKM